MKEFSEDLIEYVEPDDSDDDDEEFDEDTASENAFLESLGFMDEESGVSILSPAGMMNMQEIEKDMIELAKESGCQCKSGYNETFVGYGYISIIGKQIVITKTKLLARDAKRSLNFEAYPMVNGRVCMSVGFNDLVYDLVDGDDDGVL